MLDTRGLTDRALSSCPVTSGASRSSIGLVLSYGFYFAHLDELGRHVHVSGT
jgi:hypothetical protein